MLKGYYSEVEKLPLQNWLDCNKGDFTACRIDPNKGLEEDDKKAWETIYNDFLSKVGLSEEAQELVDLVMERAELQLDYLETRVRSKLNRINELTGKILAIQASLKENTGMKSVTSVLNLISKKQGYQVKIKDLTTLAYFELLKDYSNG